MSDEIDLIADAVAAELNTQLADWGYPSVVAQALDVPVFDAKELKGLHLSCVPMVTRHAEQVARNRIRFEHEVHVDVRKRIGNSKPSNRELKELTSRIAEHFSKQANRNLPGYAAAALVGVERSAVYQPETLIEKGIFATVVALTFRTLRAPQ